jgi:hypothetical protein
VTHEGLNYNSFVIMMMMRMRPSSFHDSSRISKSCAIQALTLTNKCLFSICLKQRTRGLVWHSIWELELLSQRIGQGSEIRVGCEHYICNCANVKVAALGLSTVMVEIVE